MATTRPAAQSTIIKRPRLTKLLDDSEARILLLCAPAGYGKTTLAREWTETLDGPVAWYRGGIEMLDAAAVALGLIEVLRGLGLDEADAVRLSARAARDNRALELGRAIGATVAAVPAGSVLVIDDYHHAESSESEALIGAFSANADVRVLITSRTRPTWFTPRMEIYGDAFVVGSDELAFTDEEANAVLPHIDDSNTNLVKQARGWPAVIGLAARQGRSNPPKSDAWPATQLYEYFAEDLFRRASPALQESLFLLALAEGADSQVTRELLGAAWDTQLTQAAEAGFITRNTGVSFEMHPLLRSFLLARLHDLYEPKQQMLTGRTLRSLGRAHQWDECLAVLAEFPEIDLIIPLLDEALDELLATGRLATIARWLSLVSPANRRNAVLLLAEAEIAVREGRDAAAQTIAEQAAELSPAPELAARAHLVAARASHMLCDHHAAYSNAERAAALTKRDELRTQAHRVELMSAIEDEGDKARELLALLRAERKQAPEQTLLVRQAGGFISLLSDGDVRKALRELEAGVDLLRHVPDPLARTGFLNLLGLACNWVAEYERALEIMGRQIEDARSNGVDFAAEHGEVSRATAFLGLRRLGAAQRLLHELEAGAARSSTFIMSEVDLLSARLKATVGDLEGAELRLRGSLPGTGVTRSCHGERLASRALYLAAAGHLKIARRIADHAKTTSSFVGTRVLRELTLLIIEVQEHDEDRLSQHGHRVITQILELGQLDPLVLACRAFPRLARCASASESTADELTKLFAASRDVDIGRAAGLAMPRALRRGEGLSPREREVHELLAQGRSNPEIAKALFISESTAKVHVRHIFEKLRVHTRAEAAAAYVENFGR